MTDSTLPPLPKAVAWQKAIRRSDEDGDCIIGWDYCWNEYEFNALLIPKRALFTAEQITEARAPLLAEIDRLKAQVAELQRLAQPLSSKPDGCTHPLCSCEAGCFYGSTSQ